MKNLESFGVQALSSEEVKEIDGGFVIALGLAHAAIVSFGIGVGLYAATH